MISSSPISLPSLPPNGQGSRLRAVADSASIVSSSAPPESGPDVEALSENKTASHRISLEGYFIDRRGMLSRIVLEELSDDSITAQAHRWLARARAETGQLMVNSVDRRSQIVFSGIGDEDQILVEVIRQSKYDMSEDSPFEAAAACPTHTAESVLALVYGEATTDRLMEVVQTLSSRGVLMHEAFAGEDSRS